MPANNRVEPTFRQQVPMILLFCAFLFCLALYLNTEVAWACLAVAIGSLLGTVAKICGRRPVIIVFVAVLCVAALKGLSSLIAEEGTQAAPKVPGPSAKEMLAECLARGDC